MDTPPPLTPVPRSPSEMSQITTNGDIYGENIHGPPAGYPNIKKRKLVQLAASKLQALFFQIRKIKFSSFFYTYETILIEKFGIF